MATIPERYLTIEPWLGPLPGWVPETDQVRIAAYEKYEEIYWSSEEGFEQVLRGDNDNPVFMPTARTIVNTINRYTAPNFSWRVEPLIEGASSDQAVVVAQLAFDQLFAREQFLSKFNSNKLKGIRKGDWFFHLIADDTKPLGRRLKIMVVNPSAVFPVYESDVLDGGDPEKVVKVHLAEQVRVDNQDRVNRLTYERIFDAGGNQTAIQVSQGIFSLQDWAKGNTSPERVIIAPKFLPPIIPAIPIYHVKNLDSTDKFGSSELRGSESVLLGINQTMSDEDVALALDGIGIYATEGGAPVDEKGNEVDWIMGPGRVLTNAKGLTRINGVHTVTPYGDHYDRLCEAVKQAAGVSDVAIGKVDSTTAESGIALLIQLGPILAYTQDKDQHVLDVMSQMFHDLCFWLAAYEDLPLIGSGEGGEPTPTVRVQPVIGDKIPVNAKATIEQIMSLRALIPPLISIATAHKMLRSAGIPLEDNEKDLLAEEALTDPLQAVADPLADTTTTDRTDAELNGEVVV